MIRLHKIILRLLQAELFVLAILVAVLNIADPNYEKTGGMIASFILPFLPDILHKIFKAKMSFRLQLTYLLFLFFSLFLGIDFDFYKTVPHFDKIIHFVSGALLVIVAWFALKYFKVNKTTPKSFQALFIICFCTLIAVLWEFFEFGCDKLLGQNMQQLIQPGVDDTMFDLLYATLGSCLGTILLMRFPKVTTNFFTRDSQPKISQN